MHFTIRRENKVEPAKIFRRERYADRRKNDIIADTVFLSHLVDFFGDKPFTRGNLDAGRISWLFDREIKSAEKSFNPKSYEALLILDFKEIEKNFPNIMK